MKPSDQVICSDCFRLLETREERTIGILGAKPCKSCGRLIPHQGGDGYHAVDATQLDEAKEKFAACVGAQLMTVFGEHKFLLHQGRTGRSPAGSFDADDLRTWMRTKGYWAWTVTFNPLSWKLDLRWREP